MSWNSIAEGWRSIDEDAVAAPPALPVLRRPPRGSWFGRRHNTPWWLISAGLHVGLLLAAALIVVERSMAIDVGAVEVRIAPRSAELGEIERPRDLFERKGVPRDDASEPLDEPAIFFPEAKESDHHESADLEDYRQMKGDSKNFLSFTTGETG